MAILLFPSRTLTAEHKERRLGVELEMSGFTLDELAQHVAKFYGGSIHKHGRYEYLISGDSAGEWTAELDFDLLKRMGREARDADSVLDDIEQSAEDVLAWFAEGLVPVELVSPPLPFSRLSSVDDLICLLREEGALGTSDSIVYAFGLHLNPEAPGLDAATLTAILKAFFCLFDWLHERADIDLTRRMTNFIDPFPKEYVRKVVSPDYWPDLSGLISDYLQANPTRNRALDMLPLFTHLDEKRVREVTDDVRIKARPTFHYRLPNCNIHEPDWGLSQAWNDWVMVERLAENPEWLEECCTSYYSLLGDPIGRLMADWKLQVERNWVRQL